MRTAAVGMFALVTMAGSAAGEVFTSTANASGNAQNGWTPVPGYPITIQNANTRGALEFSLASLPPAYQITAIQLRLLTGLPHAAPNNFWLYAYPGDGQITASDFQRTDVFFRETGQLDSPVAWYYFPATDIQAINQALGWGTHRHLGFVIRGFGGVNFTADQLFISYVPIPAPATIALAPTVLLLRRKRP